MSPLTSLLHDSIRGTLDNIIDSCITWIPEWATEYRRKKQRRFRSWINHWNDLCKL